MVSVAQTKLADPPTGMAILCADAIDGAPKATFAVRKTTEKRGKNISADLGNGGGKERLARKDSQPEGKTDGGQMRRVETSRVKGEKMEI